MTVNVLKHFKIKEAAPTCFGLEGNHHQGAQHTRLTGHITQT